MRRPLDDGAATAACTTSRIGRRSNARRSSIREGKLNQYIEELVAKYPDKYIEAIRHDLTHDKEFAKVITDLDLDETSDDFEGDQDSAEG